MLYDYSVVFINHLCQQINLRNHLGWYYLNKLLFSFCSLSESNLLEAAIVLEEFCKVRTCRRAYIYLALFEMFGKAWTQEKVGAYS